MAGTPRPKTKARGFEMKEFEDIWPLMRGLWPHAELGDGFELRNLYRERLGRCKPELLEQAIKDVRANYSSRTPELKWILERYRALLRERKSQEASVSREDTSAEEEAAFLEEVERDREKTAFNSLLTPEEIDAVREEVARRVFLAGMVGKIHGPPETWSHFAKGIAWAIHSSSLSDQSQGPSQGQRQPA